MHKSQKETDDSVAATPVLLSVKSHGQQGLAGYGPSGRKESDMTEATSHGQKGTKRVTWGGRTLPNLRTRGWKAPT